MEIRKRVSGTVLHNNECSEEQINSIPEEKADQKQPKFSVGDIVRKSCGKILREIKEIKEVKQNSCVDFIYTLVNLSNNEQSKEYEDDLTIACVSLSFITKEIDKQKNQLVEVKKQHKQVLDKIQKEIDENIALADILIENKIDHVQQNELKVFRILNALKTTNSNLDIAKEIVKILGTELE